MDETVNWFSKQYYKFLIQIIIQSFNKNDFSYRYVNYILDEDKIDWKVTQN